MLRVWEVVAVPERSPIIVEVKVFCPAMVCAVPDIKPVDAEPAKPI